MKIVHVTHRYPPAIGGAETWLQEIARRLASQAGHRVEVHTLALHDELEYWQRLDPAQRVGAYGGRELDGAIEVVRHAVSVPRRLLRIAFKLIDRSLGLYLFGPHSLSLYRALPDAIRQADLVHLHTHPYPHIVLGLLLSRRIGRPAVVTPHFHPAMALHLSRRSVRVLGMADRVFAVTELERDALVGYGVPAEKIVVTGNGVDLDRYRELARTPVSEHLDLSRDDGIYRVCYLGRKVDYKGVDVLIEATRRVRASHPVELVLVGPGTDWFYRLVESLPAGDRGWIRDLGVLSESDKLAVMRSSNLLVQPSPHEAFGIAFLEAWGCGLPVIGADSGAVPTVIERGGLVFRPGDPGALAAAMRRMIEEPETAQSCARRGAERVEREFNWDRLAHTVASTYREVRPTPRRVLVVSALYPPYSFGGAEVMARIGAVGLAGRGYEVQVLGTYRAPNLPRWRVSKHRDQGTLVHYCSVKYEDNFPGFARHNRAPEAEEVFRRLIRRWRPELVHFHNLQTLSHRLIDIAEDEGIATVMTLHDYWPICFKHTRLLDDDSECLRNGWACLSCRPELIDSPEMGMVERNAGVRGSFDRLRRLLAPARYITERFVADGIPRERFRLHPYGFDLERFRRIAAARTPRQPLRLGFLGYIGRHKGVFVLAQAALRLRGAFRLLVYGAGDVQPELARTVAGLGDRVEFRGPCPHERIHEAFAEIDVLVLPAIWPDNFPVSVLEAFASGTAVVASDAGGMREQVVPDANGFLVPRGNVAALADTLQKLIDEPALVARLAEGASASSSAYTLDRYLDRLEGFYAEAFHAQPSRARSRPLVVHSGLHSDPGTRELYDALGRHSARGLEIEALAARHARDSDLEQACAVVLVPESDDYVELALRAFAYDRAVLARADDPPTRMLLERAASGSLFTDSTDLAARLQVLAERQAAPPPNAGADDYVRRLLDQPAG